MDIEQLLAELVRQGDSDVLLRSGEVPHVRTRRGNTVAIAGSAVVQDGDIESVLRMLGGDEGVARFREVQEYEVGFAREGLGRFRATFFMTIRGWGLTVRYVPNVIPSPQEIGIPPIVQHLALLPDGLILITGPNGHGKSTTLASLIEHINQHREVHIVTIEDPVEFVFTKKKALFSQREVGRNTQSFAAAMKGGLRQAVDVLVLGEMRDRETIAAALTLAETGHLVLSTLHTQSAARTVERIVDVFPAEQQGQVCLQLAHALTAVVSQKLIPRKDGNGRVAAREILIATDAVRHAIRSRHLSEVESQMQINRKAGMLPFDEHLFELVYEGVIARDQALLYARDRASLMKKLG